ncbi:hypothetical protein L7F22_008149 [Adiantum nelumboides]|nr:hypothetical protein [Adiantum nelumboides]
MVGHTLARLYASILEQQLSSWAEGEGVGAKGEVGFRRRFSTLDHLLTLKAIIEEGRSHGRRIYCSFVDFRKVFDTVPRARLMRRLQEIEVPTVLTWGIMALYRSVMGHVRTPEGISDLVHSTIGVKQGCPLFPTLLGLYVDEVSDYIDRVPETDYRFLFTRYGTKRRAASTKARPTFIRPLSALSSIEHLSCGDPDGHNRGEE